MSMPHESLDQMLKDDATNVSSVPALQIILSYQEGKVIDDDINGEILMLQAEIDELLQEVNE